VTEFSAARLPAAVSGRDSNPTRPPLRG